MTSDVRLRIALPVIILAQLFGTSLWFSINGVWLSLSSEQGFTKADLGAFTLAVQLGFIIGTLSLALTGLADRYKASMIFCISSVFGALVNTLFILAVDHFMLAWLLRLLTGLCLAGIYPMGMKLVISWVPKYAGSALSWLLAMLTLGTVLPHLMRGFTLGLGWQAPLFTASVLAVLGGITVGALGCGPHLPATAKRAALSQGLSALKIPNFRSVAGGYFGHCWELYAFWMLVPLLVVRPVTESNWSLSSIPWLSFALIGIGALGCLAGGWLSRAIGGFAVARLALISSGLLCLIYPLLTVLPPFVLLVVLMLWGITVIADSPQFSALAAQVAPADNVGSSLAVMNAVGFALTVPAIWLVSFSWPVLNEWVSWLLLPGPLLGLLALSKFDKENRHDNT